MARIPEWLTRWEAEHTVPAVDVLRSLVARGVDMGRVCFEFDADPRAIRRWCKTVGILPPHTVVQLSPEERQRRSEHAKAALGNRVRTRTDLTVDGETLPRSEWYKRYGGSAGRYYDADDNAAVAYIKERREAVAKGAPVRKPGIRGRGTGVRHNNSEMRKRMSAALPYARAAVAGLDEDAIRVKVRAELEKLAQAKARTHEQGKAHQTETGEEAGRPGDEG